MLLTPSKPSRSVYTFYCFFTKHTLKTISVCSLFSLLTYQLVESISLSVCINVNNSLSENCQNNVFHFLESLCVSNLTQFQETASFQTKFFKRKRNCDQFYVCVSYCISCYVSERAPATSFVKRRNNGISFISTCYYISRHSVIVVSWISERLRVGGNRVFLYDTFPLQTN